MPRFTTLYSGSSGNAAVIEENGRFLLVDMGASCKATLAGLAELELSPENLCGILVTHEHIDHIRGLKVFLKRFPVPVYGSEGTLEAVWGKEAVPANTRLLLIDGGPKDIEGFVVESFETSHDAAASRGYFITTPSESSMTLATDLGELSPSIIEYLEKGNLAALESNYDPEMLAMGSYPYYLKQRIKSPLGHLSNQQSADVAAQLIEKGCRRLALCHLSAENNMPTLAKDALEQALAQRGSSLPEDCVVQVSRRHTVSPWMEF